MTERLTSEMPLRFAAPDDYARVVAALREADFSEETICRTLKLGDMSDLARMRQALSNIKATRFIYGALAARRRMPEEQGEPFTMRVKMNDDTAGADFEEALRTHLWPAPN